MRRIVLTSLCLALMAPGCEKTTAPEPAQTETDTAQAETETEAEAEAEAEPTEEEIKAAEEAARAERLKQRFAELEKAREAEAARWTDDMRADAKKLAGTKFKSTKSALPKILKGSHRKPGNADRDAARHPAETLTFFGIKPTMTVVEVGPGGGWYTELLAPLLAAKGKLVVDAPNPDGPETEGATFYGRRVKYFLDSSPELYGKVELITADSENAPYGPAGSADAVLVIRGLHGNARSGSLDKKLTDIFAVLKPGGTFGVVQHRAAEGADPMKAAEQGYLPEAWLIEKIEAAGFKLDEKSEINANPKDTHDHPEGVWTLPPTLALGDKDKDKYVEIGESDRMTLRFKKPK